MGWKTKIKIDKQGIGRPFLLAAQFCNECNKKLTVLFKGSTLPDTWLWRECELCGDPICSKCSDNDICLTCLQNPQ